MKLDQIIDKVVDQNEIESKYLWNSTKVLSTEHINRINLSSLTIDLPQTISKMMYIKYCAALPDDKVFGVSLECSEPNAYSKHLFISDHNFSIKHIKSPKNKEIDLADSIILASCFYDDTIFIFEHLWDVDSQFGYCLYWFKKYSVSQNRWVDLSSPPLEFPNACIGFNQKIIITDKNQEIWVYDIILDSYSKFFVNIISEESGKILFKNAGKIYLIIQTYINWIYVCNGNLSCWTFLHASKAPLYYKSDNSYNVLYENSIYYSSDTELYKFDLAKLKAGNWRTVNLKLRIRLDI